MKKLLIIISLLVVLSLLIVLCSYLWYKDMLKRDKDGALIYNGDRYILYEVTPREDFSLNYKTPDFAGYYKGYVYPDKKHPTKKEAYFSEFDSEKNILFSFSFYERMWLKEGFEFPDVYECRIYKMETGYGETLRTVWETENDFLTLNDIIDEKLELSGAKGKFSIKCYLEDYRYLFSQFAIYYLEDEIYIRITDNGPGYTIDLYSIKPEYADMFRLD